MNAYGWMGARFCDRAIKIIRGSSGHSTGVHLHTTHRNDESFGLASQVIAPCVS